MAGFLVFDVHDIIVQTKIRFQQSSMLARIGMFTISLDIPDELATELQPHQNRLIDFLRLGFEEWQKRLTLSQRVSVTAPKKKRLTARQLLNSDLVGMWQNRTDIVDSPTYARQLRQQVQIRHHENF